MKKQPVAEYFWFGACFRFLQDIQENTKIHDNGMILDNLKKLQNFLRSFDLTVTERVAESLLSSIHQELQDSAEHAVMTEDQAIRLSDIMNKIRTTLNAEIRGFEAFITTPKRLDIKSLMDDVSALFSPGVFFSLPDLAQYDFSEAGKCITFERPTAAAFHILRATEGVLRFFYKSMVRQKRIKILMWGPMIDELKLKKKMQKHTVLLNHLNNIKNSFRNPTQHPEKIYDIHEVQDLWSLCVEVVNRMIRILKNEKRI